MKTKLTIEQKEENKRLRKELKEQKREEARILSEKNQPEIKDLTITIEWKKSRTWGANPHASVEIHYKDHNAGEWQTGYFRKGGFTCSGCGYDKESTVIAQIFNEFLKYKLWKLEPEALKGGNGSGDKGNAPYGIHLYSENRPHYGGGIGVNCYYAISKYIGGEFKHIASGKYFDVYTYTDL